MSVDLLAIAAHPDDVEQTCGGTLIKMAEKGYRTGVLDLTAGDMGTRGTPEQRVAEACDAAKIMQVSHRENLHFPDARLENTISARMTLAVKIRETRARVVILPYWQGRHPDHYRAAELGPRYQQQTTASHWHKWKSKEFCTAGAARNIHPAS